MTEEAKRVKIAEACGIKPHPTDGHCIAGTGAIPNYFHDLNACAEIRKALTVSEQGLFGDCLARMRQTKCIELEKHFQLRDADDDSLFAPNGDGWFAVIDFTAAECAEAFGRVKGLW